MLPKQLVSVPTAPGFSKWIKMMSNAYEIHSSQGIVLVLL